jgi:hypothetical protein
LSDKFWHGIWRISGKPEKLVLGGLMKHVIQFSLLVALLAVAACGKNKSGGGSDVPSQFNPINVGLPASQSFQELRQQMASKDPRAGLVVHQPYGFYTSTVSMKNSSWWIFDFNSYTTSTVCDAVRVTDLNSLSLYIRRINCSTLAASGAESTGQFNGVNSPAIQEILNIDPNMVSSIRLGQVSFQGQTYRAYSITVMGWNGMNAQVVAHYVVSPEMPLFLNPIYKTTSNVTEGLMGAQISIQ